MNKPSRRQLMMRKTSSRSMRKRGKFLYFFCLASLLLYTLVACGKNAPIQPTQIQTTPTQITPTQTTPARIGLPADLIPGDNARSLVYAGVERSYILHIPPGFD